MKKKILTLTLCVAMLATVAVSGTLAYFTDSDADVNVMTAGNVKIVQNETDRDGKEYTDNQKLLPAVFPNYDWTQGGNPDYDGTMTGPDGKTHKIWDEAINNEIDKVISVTNTGSLPAYVRTIVLMENDENNKIAEKIHGLWNNSDGQYRVWIPRDDGAQKETQVTYEGTTYSVAVCTYTTALASGATSAPSLQQIWLDPTADNDWYDLLGDGQFEIIALSQACQTEGFENAATALNTTFGEVTEAKVAEWLEDATIKTHGTSNIVGGTVADPAADLKTVENANDNTVANAVDPLQ